MALLNTNSSTYAVLNYNLKQLEVGVSGLVASTPYEASVGETVAVDTTSTPIVVEPPSNPSPNDVFRIVDARGNASTNNITVDFVAAGVNFQGASSNDTISTDNLLKGYMYIDSTYGYGAL